MRSMNDIMLPCFSVAAPAARKTASNHNSRLAAVIPDTAYHWTWTGSDGAAGGKRKTTPCKRRSGIQNTREYMVSGKGLLPSTCFRCEILTGLMV